MRHASVSWLIGSLFVAHAAHAAPADPEPSVDVMLRSGDTLIGLSTTLFGSPDAWREVARLNRLPNPNRVRPGQVLRVPTRLLRPLPVPTTLVTVEGEVSIDGLAATSGAALGEGQSIRTADRASAVLQLADGSRVKLPPSSLAEVIHSRRYGARGEAPNDTAPSSGLFSGALRLLRGSVEVFATKVLRARPIELTTPTAVIGVRGTRYRAGLTDSAEGAAPASHVEVLEGQVQVDARRELQASAPGAALSTGFAARVDADSRVVVPTPMLPAPDLSALPALFERPLVRFSLPGSGADRLRVQVAVDAGFDRIVSDQTVPPATDVRIADLPDGAWFVRARRQDAQGLEGFDAQRPFTLKARPEPPPVSAPPPRAKQTVGTVQFSWAGAVQSLSYRLQIARDAGFTQLLLDRSGIEGTAFSTEIAEAGVYHWRIASTAAGDDRGPFGDPQQFELRERPTPPEGGVSEDGRSVTLRWSGRPQDRHQVELARDEAFTDIVARDELPEPRWSPAAPGRPGTYYFRYRSVEPDGFVSAYSGTLTIEVPFDKRLLLLLAPLLLFGL